MIVVLSQILNISGRNVEINQIFGKNSVQEENSRNEWTNCFDKIAANLEIDNKFMEAIGFLNI